MMYNHNIHTSHTPVATASSDKQQLLLVLQDHTILWDRDHAFQNWEWDCLKY